MTARIISGTELAASIREELKARVTGLVEKHGTRPGLVTILVGEDPGSVSYVTGKQRTAREIGFHSVQESLPADVAEEELVALVRRYNADRAIHGILVQLPRFRSTSVKTGSYTRSTRTRTWTACTRRTWAGC